MRKKQHIGRCCCCCCCCRTLWICLLLCFVQFEQQKYQNKYGYDNHKYHSNTNMHEWYKISLLSIYTFIIIIIIFLSVIVAIVLRFHGYCGCCYVYLLLAIWIGYLIRIRIGIWKPSFTFDKNTIYLIQIDWSDSAKFNRKEAYNNTLGMSVTMIQNTMISFIPKNMFPICSLLCDGEEVGMVCFSLFVVFVYVCVRACIKKVIHI